MNNSVTDYSKNLIKRLDPYLYKSLKFAPDKIKKRAFPLLALHLEISMIPQNISDPSVGIMRYEWWKETIINLNNARANHPVITSLQKINLTKKEINQLAQIIEIRKDECSKLSFKKDKDLDNYLKNTIGSLWKMIIKKLKYQDYINNYITAIKYSNIAESLYYRQYNNHPFLTEEFLQNIPKKKAYQKQEIIFKEVIKKCCNFLTKIEDNNKINKSEIVFLKIHGLLLKKHLYLLDKNFKQNSKPPRFSNLRINLYITFFRFFRTWAKK